MRVPQIPPESLYNLTGSFSGEEAMRKMNKAAGVFLLSLRDLGGEVEDTPEMYGAWATACFLNSVKGFEVMLWSIIECGWVVRYERTAGKFLKMTGKGQKKAEEFAKHLVGEDSAIMDDDDDVTV